MRNNCGTTTLKRTRQGHRAMRDFDQLPKPLRAWVAKAHLPWRAGSVKSAYDKALKRTGSPALALAELDRLQRTKVAKDAAAIWGATHPAAFAPRGGPHSP